QRNREVGQSAFHGENRMKGFRIFWGILFLILIIMCFTYHSRLMPFLLLTMLLICVSSFFGALLTRFFFSVKVTYPEFDHVYRKDEIAFSIRIKNNFILPLTPVRVYIGVLVQDVYLPQKKMLVACVPPFQEVLLKIKNIPSFRGEYRIGFEKAEFFDILKIFRFVKKSKIRYTFISVPRKLEIHAVEDNNQEENEVSRAKPNPLNFEKNIFSHLREYREGESLRHIHWKLSARILEGDLIVKQMEANHDYSALVFCDFTCEFPKIEETLEVSDKTIETTLSVIRLILKSRNSACAVYQSARTEIINLHDYNELLECLTFLPAQPAFPSNEFTALLDEHRGEIHPERAVYMITASVTDKLVEKMRELGLIIKNNVVLVVIPSALNQHDLIEYLENETQITVLQIEV
ncbi:MAG: DUF58 domain-containing protein, partial [Oscillospiraceae bacterium]|nr:DUF58 domain-containing protein [Oscillospiraceae bacterium]